MKLRTLLIAAGAALSLAGCQLAQPINSTGVLTRGELQKALAQSRTENQALLDNFNLAAIEFYEDTADAYYILGKEYYDLSQTMEKQGKKDQAASFIHMAEIYAAQQKDLTTMAERRRQALSPAARAKLEPDAKK